MEPNYIQLPPMPSDMPTELIEIVWRFARMEEPEQKKFLDFMREVREAKDLPEDMIEQVIEFMRYLKYASKKEQTNRSINNNMTFHRSINPLADEFIAIADDFDETPECFKEYI